MSIETPLSASYRRAGWLLWISLTAIITFVVALSIYNAHERSVTPSYREAVWNWFAGQPLYNMQGHGFLYLPQAALVFAPWAILPHAACEIVWRWSIIGVLAASVSRLTRLLNGDGRWFFAMSLSSTVLAWGCARNGQATLLITGMMILAVADVSESRWWRATFLLALAFAFKPLALVLIMLVGVLYPRMSWRLAIGLFLVAVVPFATQRPDYVMSQYRACHQNLQITFEVGETSLWAQFFSMLQVAGIHLPATVRTAIRLLAAVSTLFACWQAVKTLSPHRAAFYLFSLTACYLMLFNSRTEGNTYAMVGPVYGALLAEAAYRLNHRRSTGWLIAAVVLTLANYELAVLMTPRDKAIWICPLVCVGVTGYLVHRLIQEVQSVKRIRCETHNQETSETQVLQRAEAA
jgi:alpha-1,2-mannosyltransferase